jgi:hypothetical protein
VIAECVEALRNKESAYDAAREEVVKILAIKAECCGDLVPILESLANLAALTARKEND